MWMFFQKCLQRKKNAHKIVVLLLVMTGVFCVGCNNNSDSTQIYELEVNRSLNPLTVETDDIRFSWKWESSEQGKQQTAYEIYVAEEEKALQKGKYIWDSGKIESDESAYIAYEGPELSDSTKYYWQVKAWDEKEICYTSTEEAYFVTCPSEKDWTDSYWISAPSKDEALSGPAEFEVDFDCQTQNSTVSFLYGVKTDEYDPYIRWELDASGEKLVYRLFDKLANAEITEELDIPSEQLVEKGVHISLQIKDGSITTYIDDKEAVTSAVTETNLGGFGFYQGRNYQSSFYDNLVIKDKTGILFQEDFAQEEQTIFVPQKVKISDGRLELLSLIHI